MNEPRIIRPYPGFIIPTRRFVDVGMPSARVTAKGRYMLRVIDAATGGVVRETPWFDNIILDAGLNRWGTGTIITGAAIGTGTSTPAATETGLQSQTVFTTTVGTGTGIVSGVTPNFNNTRTFIYRTALGALNGNFTEVGVGWASGSMFSRALILDIGGNPTSIAVTSAQQLDIFYQLSIFPPLTDFAATVGISGTDYGVTGRAAGVTSTAGTGAWSVGVEEITHLGRLNNVYTGGLGAITANPSGTSYSGAYTAATNAYVNNSLSRTGSSSYSLTQGNLAGGARSVAAAWAGIGSFQYEFDPPIPKDATRSMVLNWSVTWARR
jgi:hypothetical protein